MGRSSVFSLEQIYRKQVVGTWSKIPEVFRYVNSLTVPAVSGGPAYGYLASGYTGTPYATTVTTVDRIDFSNDTATASARGPLSLGRSGAGTASGQGNGLGSPSRMPRGVAFIISS